ncbi:MAG TPA: hypothetical protein VHD83_08375 [Puia sp.]|nr:hypothetical protein [Puia sp.]
MMEHLSETAIQQYAMDGENSPAWMREHVGVCEVCHTRVSNYRLIFHEVEQMDVLVAHVEELVMLKLERPKQKRDWSLSYWLGGAGVAMLATGWTFRASLLNIAGDISGAALYILVGAAVSIAIATALRMIVRYRHQLKNLDLS